MAVTRLIEVFGHFSLRFIGSVKHRWMFHKTPPYVSGGRCHAVNALMVERPSVGVQLPAVCTCKNEANISPQYLRFDLSGDL